MRRSRGWQLLTLDRRAILGGSLLLLQDEIGSIASLMAMRASAVSIIA